MPLPLPARRDQFKGQQPGTYSPPASTACGLTPGRDLPAKENNLGHPTRRCSVTVGRSACGALATGLIREGAWATRFMPHRRAWLMACLVQVGYADRR